MLVTPMMVGLCILLQEDAALPPPLTTENTADDGEAAQQELPPDVADQLLDFDTQKVVELEQDGVQVRVLGQGRVGTLKVKDVKTPVLGRQRRTLSWPEFYDLVERPDLRRKWAWLAVGGAGLTVGGLVASFGSAVPFLGAMAVGLGLVFWDRRQGTGNSTAFSPLTGLGVGVILAGAAVMTVMIIVGGGMMWMGRQLPDQPVDNADLLALAQEYNRGVLTAAGVTSDERR